MADLIIQEHKIPARDGYPLAATTVRPGLSDRVVLINSATAVPRQFYGHFAGALAEAGFIVITYDYRGIGGSRPETLRGFPARMRDWALLDMAGVVDWIRTDITPRRLFAVGHSFGGQAAGLLDNASAIDAMVGISAQSGHWRWQGGEQKWMVLLHIYLTLPLLTTMFGYAPWGRFAGGEDLPAGVASEWTRWCRHRNYILGDETLPLQRYREFKAPVLAYSIDDDKWGTPASVDVMMKAYPRVERRHIVPGEHDLSKLGHVGYFRSTASALWPEVIEWFQEQ